MTLRLSVLALITYIGHRLPAAHAQRQSDVATAGHAQQQSDQVPWSLAASPYGPGEWLTGACATDVAYAFIPPGARGSQDETDLQRQGWRHLTVDADLAKQPTVTILDTHEVYTRVPKRWRGWVMEQSLRHADGAVRGADLLQSVAAMGVRADLLDDALRLLGRTEKLSVQHICRAAKSFATPGRCSLGVRCLLMLVNTVTVAAERASRAVCAPSSEHWGDMTRPDAADDSAQLDNVAAADFSGGSPLPIHHR